MLWIGKSLLPLDGLIKAPTTVSLQFVNQLDTVRRFIWNEVIANLLKHIPKRSYYTYSKDKNNGLYSVLLKNLYFTGNNMGKCVKSEVPGIREIIEETKITIAGTFEILTNNSEYSVT